MYCTNCGSQIPDNARFCPNCGTTTKEEENKDTGETKSYARGALFHIWVSEARINGLPWKLAELAAVVTCVIMGIWSYATIGSPQIGALILFFIIYSIVFQIIARLVFFLMEVISRRAYNAYIRSGQGDDGYAGTEEGRYGHGSAQRTFGSQYDQSSPYGEGGPHADRYERYNSSYERKEYERTTESGITYEEAREMFHLKDSYTMKDLKKERNILLSQGKIHPDDGGDPEKFKKLMQAYDLLKLYVKK